MSATTSPEQIEAGKARLIEISNELAKTEALYAERTELFYELVQAGVTQREIARLAGVSEVMVSKALRNR